MLKRRRQRLCGKTEREGGTQAHTRLRTGIVCNALWVDGIGGNERSRASFFSNITYIYTLGTCAVFSGAYGYTYVHTIYFSVISR